ncbi:(E)-beta-ocimene synthase, chloroplastic [Artemisia annua]|uniref:(E)-beta-ocimene synthase, chloroplastic n=1 Tax=Artemisia annua TaxID=35608 RepID=A0A2U1LXS5_ARTAN|nr:(E)-beta-ocimene synthase, chloroplastic [Artemisia annua]
MIMDYENCDFSSLELLELIDNIERLGLGRRFQTNITRVLNKIAGLDENNLGLKQEEDNLHALSLKFRILRQHDFHRKFKESHGGLTGGLHTDVKGLLSIYEASYLALEGELDLHEAKLFATKNLLKLNGHENEAMKDHVNHALDTPLYRRMLRWWEKTGLARRLSFVRDRLVECFFWSVGMVFEPQYHSCRVALTKVGTLITTIDDIYDVYGSLNELKVFTNAVKRSREAFLVEAKWTHNNYMPTFEEYLDNAWRSVSGMVILTHGYFLINQDVKNDAVESLEKKNDLYRWSSMLFRLYNDLAASSDEKDKDKGPNAISCYMHEHGVSVEVAREHIQTLIDEAWMKMIEARIACSEHLTDPSIDMAINLARVSNCTYQYGDGIKAPKARTKDRDEKDKDKGPNAISCYMHEHGVSVEVAREHIQTLIDEAWMKMIEARIACSEHLTDPSIDMAINLARVSNCTYQYGDGIKAPKARTKDRVISVIIEPITI